MPPRQQSALSVVLLGAASLLLYGWSLGATPAPASVDERIMVTASRELAATGRDAGGRRMPLFVQAAGETWLQPVPAYAAALVFATGQRDDTAARWPSALVGMVDVVLAYFIARRLLRSDRWAVAAGALVLLAPAHFVYARIATDAIFLVPFVLGWMLALVAFLDRPQVWLVPIATGCLGLGVYTQPSAPVTAAAYLIVTAVAVARSGQGSARLYGLGLAGFAAPLVGLGIWFVLHPDTYADTMGRWAVHAAHIRFPLDGLRAQVNWNTLSSRTALYWSFFNPADLFFAAPPGTGPGLLRSAAPLTWPVGILMAAGIVRTIAQCRPAMTTLLMGALVGAPLAGAALTEPHAIGRALAFVPIASVLAASGARSMVASRTLVRWTAVALLVLIPMAFIRFYRAF